MSVKPLAAATCGCVLAAIAGPAAAWGDVGHKVTALIAYPRLNPKAKAAVDAILAADTDTLTAPDFASRATWADKWRTGHRETAAWHFVDLELDTPDLNAACFGFPKLDGKLASAGPAQDCVIDKIDEFEAELKAAGTTPAEKLLALKFLMHFVGDLHQPLHASDHSDKGGNCIALSPEVGGSKTLHGYWDTGVMPALGGTPEAISVRLTKKITAGDAKAWAQGTARDWAKESFALSKADAYALPSRPTCAAPGSVSLSAAYQAQAQTDVSLQLERAGVRMAAVLNAALGA
jgi:hypothetical protein